MSDLIKRLRMAAQFTVENSAIFTEAADRIAELEAGYAEAIEDIESWSGYASDYFREKHDLDGCLKEHRAILGKETPR